MLESKTITIDPLKGEQEIEGISLLADVQISAEKKRPEKRIAILVSKLEALDGQTEVRRENLISLICDLPRQETLPTWIIFTNEAVELLTKDSPILPSLTSLHEEGTSVLACQKSVARIRPEKKLPYVVGLADSHTINACLLAADLVISY